MCFVFVVVVVLLCVVWLFSVLCFVVLRVCVVLFVVFSVCVFSCCCLCV